MWLITNVLDFFCEKNNNNNNNNNNNDNDKQTTKQAVNKTKYECHLRLK